MINNTNNFISPKQFWKASIKDLYALDQALAGTGGLKLIPVGEIPGFTWAISKTENGYKREVWDALGNKLPLEFCKNYTDFKVMLEAAINGACFCKYCGKKLLPLVDTVRTINVVSVCCEDCYAALESKSK